MTPGPHRGWLFALDDSLFVAINSRGHSAWLHDCMRALTDISEMRLLLENEKAANVEWAKIDKQVTDAAPMATLFTPKHIDFLSKRVGNFVFSKQFYWLVDQSWVK